MAEGGLLDYWKNASFTLCQSFFHTCDRRTSRPLLCLQTSDETRLKERFPLAVMDFATLVPDALLPPTTSRCQWQQWPPSRPKTLLYYTHIDVKNTSLLYARRRQKNTSLLHAPTSKTLYYSPFYLHRLSFLSQYYHTLFQLYLSFLLITQLSVSQSHSLCTFSQFYTSGQILIQFSQNYKIAKTSVGPISSGVFKLRIREINTSQTAGDCRSATNIFSSKLR